MKSTSTTAATTITISLKALILTSLSLIGRCRAWNCTPNNHSDGILRTSASITNSPAPRRFGMGRSTVTGIQTSSLSVLYMFPMISTRIRESARLYMSDDNEENVSPIDDDDDNNDGDNVLDEKFSDDVGSSLDWGGAYGQLRKRIGDVKEGKSGPSYALFRMMTRETPNEAIASLVRDASPEVINAMSGAVSSLLGGLSNPSLGMDTIVKATGDKLTALCFQLQMTGYMFRNAEYVMALRDIMNIRSTNIEEYRKAFNRIDKDGSGFIEASEVEELLEDVYGEKPPAFEVHSFLRFFDENRDGRVSWSEFEKGLGAIGSDRAAKAVAKNMLALPGSYDDVDDDNEEETPSLKATVSGVVEVELEDGTTIEVEAKDYIDGLKAEALALKQILAQERGIPTNGDANTGAGIVGGAPGGGSLSAFIASLGEKNVKTLTEGISPAVLDAMKLLGKKACHNLNKFSFYFYV